ncbi:MAG TPA: sialidase family protein [Gemmatimonadales bacterium]|nr:sialidase family protein [Gemmatimonadales bacterium]
MTHRWRAILFLHLLTVGCANAARSVPAGPARTDLAESGVEYPVYRIPALAVTNRGTLIAAYDGRPAGADLPARIAVLIRRSTDGGATWLPRQVVRADTAPLGFGDPSLIVDRQTGRIFLFHAASIRQGYHGAHAGNDPSDPDVLHADYAWSDDDGRSWQHRRITRTIKDSAWGGIFAASGTGIQLRHGPHAGRLVQQYVVRSEGRNFGVSIWSDDHGTTWQHGTLVGPDVDENKTVELSDGRVMLNGRFRTGRQVALSTDGGASYTGLHLDSTLVDPGNNAAILRVAPDAAPDDPRSHWLLFSNTNDLRTRRNLTVRLSCDDGTTWSGGHVIEPGAAGYSTLAMLPDSRIGVLYERGDYEWITFTTLALADVGSCQ